MTKIGLALGSGSARGWAHIGVIRALNEVGIQVDCVAGTSIGSLVGGAFASGKVDELEEFVRQLDWKQIVSFLDVVFPRSGLIDGGKVTDFFRTHVQDACIEDLPIPYSAVATDLTTGREQVLNSGDLIDAVRASISLPGMFTPVKTEDGFLVDGGLVNPVPVSVVRNMGADFVIAVDLNHDIVAKKGFNRTSQDKPKRNGLPAVQWPMAQELSERFGKFKTPALSQFSKWMRREPSPTIFDVLTGSINIMESQITAVRLATDPPDMLLQPHLGHIGFMEFNRAEEAIEEGYRATKEQLSALKQIFNSEYFI